MLLALVAAGYVLLRHASGTAGRLRAAAVQLVAAGRRAGEAVGGRAARAAAALWNSSQSTLEHLREVGATLVSDVRGGTAPATVAASFEPPVSRLQPRPRATTPTKEAVLKPEHAPAPPKTDRTLKRKLTSAADPNATDVRVLKEKLAKKPVKRKPRLAPVPTTKVAGGFAGERCRIEWWRGYVRSTFYAKERKSDGEEAILSTSPSFRWGKPSPRCFRSARRTSTI